MVNADKLSQFATYFGDPGLINTQVDRYRAVTREMDTEARAGALYFSLKLDRDTPRFDRPLAYLVGRARSGQHVQGYGALTPWLLMLAGGLMLRVLVSGPRSESASAFLMGIALVFIAFGFLKGNGT